MHSLVLCYGDVAAAAAAAAPGPLARAVDAAAAAPAGDGTRRLRVLTLRCHLRLPVLEAERSLEDLAGFFLKRLSFLHANHGNGARGVSGGVRPRAGDGRRRGAEQIISIELGAFLSILKYGTLESHRIGA